MLEAPLHGRRIVVTRAQTQAQPLLRELRRLGAIPISLPTIEFAPPQDWALLDYALREVATFSGFIFTSANGVRFFFQRAAALQLDLRQPEASWVCAIGPATAHALREHGWRCDFIPESYVAEGVLETLSARDLSADRILIPRAGVARDVLPRELGLRGALVFVVEAYRTILPAASRQLVDELFPRTGAAVDAILFTSSSTAENFVALAGDDYRSRLGGVTLAAIGPITAATLERLGLPVAVRAETFTTAGLVNALLTYWSLR